MQWSPTSRHPPLQRPPFPGPSNRQGQSCGDPGESFMPGKDMAFVPLQIQACHRRGRLELYCREGLGTHKGSGLETSRTIK